MITKKVLAVFLSAFIGLQGTVPVVAEIEDEYIVEETTEEEDRSETGLDAAVFEDLTNEDITYEDTLYEDTLTENEEFLPEEPDLIEDEEVLSVDLISDSEPEEAFISEDSFAGETEVQEDLTSLLEEESPAETEPAAEEGETEDAFFEEELTDMLDSEEPPQVGRIAYGKCGKNMRWILNDDGTMNITGTGEMYNWYPDYYCDWHEYRDSIKKITIASGVQSIGEFAFYELDKVTSISIPNTVTTIGERAFAYCESLKTQTIPDSVTTLTDFMFLNCSSLESVTFSSNLKSMKFGVFHKCSSLKSMKVPDSVTEFKAYMFEYCYGLTSVVLPKNLTSIPDATFRGCESLPGVNIPNGVKTIGEDAFNGCTNLKSVGIPSGVTSIGSRAFLDCKNVTSISIPYGVKTIFEETFAGTGISAITIPETITEIKNYAFARCRNLSSITFKGNAPKFAIGYDVWGEEPESYAFQSVTATVCYPGGNSTWTSNVMQNYGGNITWKPWFNNPTIKLSDTRIIITPGQSKTVTVSGLVKGDKVVSWKSANNAIATVKGGIITGVKDGKTKVTVTLLSELKRDIEVVVVTLNQPKLIGAYNGSKGIGIKFVKQKNAKEYVIWRKENGKWSSIRTIKSNSLELQISGDKIMYTDTTVKNNYGKGYIYSVAAKYESLVTSYDKKGCAIYRLKPPTLTKAVNSAAGTATVYWTSVFGRTETNGNYDLQIAEYVNGKAGSFRSVRKLPGYNNLTLNADVTGLKKGTTYVFLIRCSKTNKDRGTFYSEYSPWLSVKITK